MNRRKKDKEFTVRQDVVTSGATGESFDLLLRFNNTVEQPELFMDELVKLVLEGLIAQYGTIVVKVNWFSEGLTVIAPNSLPQQDFLDASVTSQEGS